MKENTNILREIKWNHLRILIIFPYLCIMIYNMIYENLSYFLMNSVLLYFGRLVYGDPVIIDLRFLKICIMFPKEVSFLWTQ